MTELWPFSVSENWFLAFSSFTSGTIRMELHGYIKDQRLHTSTKATTLVAFVQELFALDSSAKLTSHASDK